MPKQIKSYQQYKDEADDHYKNIMAKYGAPQGAKPPTDKDVLPAASDRQYRQYAFLKKRTLEAWPKSGRHYP